MAITKEVVSTRGPIERGFLVGVELKRPDSMSDELLSFLPIQESLEELTQLARTAGIDVVGQDYQRLDHYNPATMIGSGKLEEIKEFLAETAANVLVFDNELSPRHQREIEHTLGEGTKVLDRTALILDIFAQHARTREGALQVELAQYEYRLPRLTRQWTHLARQAGGGSVGGGSGGVGLRGPGETQLEMDRREIGRRISRLKDDLEKVRAHRGRHRARRKQSGIPVVAIVGYTNAGKSTLLNTITGSNVLAQNQLFATLDPTTRRCKLPEGREALFTDTVGFIQKLPTQLVAAFRATLEEVTEADMLLHVVDVTHPHALAQVRAVEATLRELEIADAPRVTALNKVDKLADMPSLSPDLDNAIPTSALTGIGIDALLERVENVLYEELVPIKMLVPYQAGDVVAMFHEQGMVERVQHLPEGVHIVGRLPGRLVGAFRPYLVSEEPEGEL